MPHYYTVPNNVYNHENIEIYREMLYELLTDEEKQYIIDNPLITVAAQNYKYPISYYSIIDDVWRGVAHDILVYISEISGLEFEIYHEPNEGDWLSVLEMLNSGDIMVMAQLLYHPARYENFLLSDSYMCDYFALLSKSSLHTLRVDEIYDYTVGIVRDTVYLLVFQEHFPGHRNTIIYNNYDDLISDLADGKVDLMMGRNSTLLALINYYGLIGYRSNIMLSEKACAVFGFPKGSEILQSIINKNLSIIDTDMITSAWLHTYFDYTGRLYEAQRPLYLTLIALSSIVIVAMFIFILSDRFAINKLKAQLNGCSNGCKYLNNGGR